jgi:hypothetical protein
MNDFDNNGVKKRIDRLLNDAAMYYGSYLNGWNNMSYVIKYKEVITELATLNLKDVNSVAGEIVSSLDMHIHYKYDYDGSDAYRRDKEAVGWLKRISRITCYDKIPILNIVPLVNRKLSDDEIINYLNYELTRDDILMLTVKQEYKIVDLLRMVAYPDYTYKYQYDYYYTENNHDKLIAYIYDKYPHTRAFCEEQLQYVKELSVTDIVIQLKSDPIIPSLEWINSIENSDVKGLLFFACLDENDQQYVKQNGEFNKQLPYEDDWVELVQLVMKLYPHVKSICNNYL